MMFEWGIGLGLGGMFLCLLGNGIVVACEFSLVKLRYSHLEESVLEAMRETRLLGKMLDRADAYSRTLRFARTLFALGGGIFLALLLAQGVSGSGSGGGWRVLATVLIFLVSGGGYYVLAELLPRAIALRYPLPTLRKTAPAVMLFRVVLYPLGLLIRKARGSIYRAMRLNLDDDLSPLDVEVQLRALGEEDTRLSPTVRKIIDKAIQIPELVVSDILLPRNQVDWLDLREGVGACLEKARKAGHSRYPLCEEDLDRCIGILHIKDVFQSQANEAELDLRKICRPLATVEADDGIEEALHTMLGLRLHMALVADAFGGVVGVLTLEGILEELVGEIQDEFDMEEEQIVAMGKNTFRVHGLTPLHDLEERTGLDLERNDVSTLSGLITADLGRIPGKGERLRSGRLQMQITGVDERKINLVEVKILPPEDSP